MLLLGGNVLRLLPDYLKSDFVATSLGRWDAGPSKVSISPWPQTSPARKANPQLKGKLCALRA